MLRMEVCGGRGVGRFWDGRGEGLIKASEMSPVGVSSIPHWLSQDRRFRNFSEKEGSCSCDKGWQSPKAGGVFGKVKERHWSMASYGQRRGAALSTDIL